LNRSQDREGSSGPIFRRCFGRSPGACRGWGIVVLSNPVQYQASLARILDSEKIVPAIRDAMWKELYGIARIRQDFLGRLRSYEPRVVINACTAKVKPQITEDILQSGIAIAAHIVETGHPSLWVFPANRSLTWRTVV